MNLLKELTKLSKKFDLSNSKLDLSSGKTVVILLMLLYIVIPVPMSIDIARFIDSFVGTILILLLIFLVFMCMGPLAGLVSVVLGYVLLDRSSKKTGTSVLRKYVPSENQKYEDVVKYNETKKKIKDSLEVEAVKEIPDTEINTELLTAEYKPLYAASCLTENCELPANTF